MLEGKRFGQLVTMVGMFLISVSYAGIVPASETHPDKYLYKLKETEEYVANARAQLLGAKAGGNDQEKAYRALRGSLQGLGTYRSYVGDYQGATDAFSEMFRSDEIRYGHRDAVNVNKDIAEIDSSHAIDAIKFVADLARGEQIVILNEAHHVPADRAFAMGLAQALRKEGFTYLACETLAGKDGNLLQDGYVTVSTGTYTREPVFAKFIMDAAASGWHLVGYEPDVPSKFRESGMAKNIIEKILKTEPEAKIFIYVGYTHAKERPLAHSDDDDSRLAAQIRRLTGIDPLTINQTTLFDQYLSKKQQIEYRHALKKSGGDRPYVLADKVGRPIQLALDDKAYDVEVVHPRYKIDRSTRRPSWMGAYFVPYDIPADLVPKKGERAVYAYLKGSSPDAIPLDVTIVRAGEQVPKLMVPRRFVKRIEVEIEEGGK